MEDIISISTQMKARLQLEFGDSVIYDGERVLNELGFLDLPIWVAQPKIRPPPPVSNKHPMEEEIKGDTLSVKKVKAIEATQ